MKMPLPFSCGNGIFIGSKFEHMKRLFLILVLFWGVIACREQNTQVLRTIPIEVIPTPKTVKAGQHTLKVMNNSFGIASAQGEWRPILDVFSKEIMALSNYNPVVGTDEDQALIVFERDSTLNNDAYRIEIGTHILVKASSAQAVSMARATLLQMAHYENGELLFPEVVLTDEPDANYRGLMVDLARNWHSLASIKKLIDLASYYKVNYLQLHFTDDQSYTLPSHKYPKLSTPERHYSFDELHELERYSQLRGVTIIPEIDVPGHAKSMVTAYPELFGIEAHEENPYIIHMGREEVYAALDTLFSEIVPIFKASPYFHIGGDEARFDRVLEDSNVQTYMKAQDLGTTDVHELYRHFLVRIDRIVKKYGKRTCVWEGFAKEGQIEIPKDIIVFEFESLYHLPDDLVNAGYTLVNTSWKPLYVVNEKKWEPKTIFDWNLWRFENWWSRSPASMAPIQLKETPLIIGAQLCSWEQAEDIEFPSLRKRLPVMVERVWNTRKTTDYDSFMGHLDHTDEVLSILTQDSAQDPVLIGHNHEEPVQ